MEIIKKSGRGVSVSYHHNFGKDYGHGVELCAGFECDAKGNIFEPKFEAGRANLADCLAGKDGVVSMGIKEYRHSWYEPAVGKCNHCRRHVTLSSFTNTCECGADYNSSGQQLAPREQWGEETGETAADILMGGYDNG